MTCDDPMCDQVLQERDDAEDALSRMFQAATGRVAEWSSAWHFADAIEEVEDHVYTLQQQLAAAREELDGCKAALHIACGERSLAREALQVAEADAEIGRKWRSDSSLETWFPITAEEIERMRVNDMRYRWLRDNCRPWDSNHEHPHALIKICRGEFQGGIGWYGIIGPESRVGIITLDKAVDLAMNATPQRDRQP